MATYYLNAVGSDVYNIQTGEKFVDQLGKATDAATSTVTCASLSSGATSQDWAATPPGLPGNASWGTNTATIKVNVTTANSAISMKVQLHRIDFAGNILESSGYTAEQALSATGVLTFTTPSKAWTAGSYSDRLMVEYFWHNTNAHGGSQTAAIEIGGSNDSLTTSITEMTGTGAGGLVGTQVFAQEANNRTTVAVGGSMGTDGVSNDIYLQVPVSAYYETSRNTNITGEQLTVSVEVQVVGTAFTGTATATTRALVHNEADPNNRRSAPMCYDSDNKRFLMFGGWDGTNKYADIWELSADQNDSPSRPQWHQLSPTGTAPDARRLGALCYDDVNHRMLMFGGYDTTDNNDVWMLDCTTRGSESWTLLSPTGTPPSARSDTHIVWDHANTCFYLFGGWGAARYNDSFKFDASTTNGAWTTLSPTGGPPAARGDHTAVWDSVNSRMVIFGGYDGTTLYNDTWALDPAANTWTELDAGTGTAPAAREYHNAVFDASNTRMLMYGGETTAGATSGSAINTEIWEFNLVSGSEAWTNRSQSDGNQPAAVYSSGHAFDPLNKRFVIFGGGDSSGLPVRHTIVFDATVTGATLYTHQIVMNDYMRGRDAVAYAFDTDLENFLIWGGYMHIQSDTDINFGQHSNEAWIYNRTNNEWSQPINNAIGPVHREGASAIYDKLNKRFIVFGGLGGQNTTNNTYYNDVWELKADANGLYKWTLLTPTGTAPANRWLHSSMYDDTNQRMIMYGGSSGTSRGTMYQDTWALDLTSGSEAWTQLSPTGTPPPGSYQCSHVYDKANQRFLVGYGYNGSGFNNTVAALDVSVPGSEAWTTLSPTGTAPTARRGMTMVYDDTTTTHRVIAFGGYDGTNHFNNVDYLDVTTAGSEAWVNVMASGAAGSPDVRRSHGTVFDKTNSVMLTWGGRAATPDTYAINARTWEMAVTSADTSWAWTEKNPKINITAQVPITGLTSGDNYHWQAWATGATSGAGPTQSFGANAESATDFSVGSGTTTTSTDLTMTLAYSVKTTTSVTKPLQYAVKTTSSLSLGLRYAVLTSTPLSRSLTYVVTAPHTVTKSLAYGVQTTHSLTLGLSYSIQRPTSLPRNLTYGVLTTGTVTKSLAYSVQTTTSVTKGLVYGVQTSHTLTLGLEYAVQTNTALTKSLQYVVTASHTVTKNLTYGVQTSHSQTLSLSYSVQTTHTLTLGLTYAVDTTHALSKNLTYVVTAAKNKTLNLTYSIGSTTDLTKTLKYVVTASHNLSLGLVYTVQTSTPISKNLTYVVTAPHSKTLSLKYVVTAAHAITLGLTYDVVVPVALTKSLAYSVQTTHSEALTLAYGVQTTHSVSLGLVYAVDATQALTKTLAYSVLTSTSKTLTLTYALGTTTNHTKTLTYGVQTTTSVQLGLTYAVLLETSITKSLKYVVTAPHSISLGLRYEVDAGHQITKGLTYAVLTSTTETKGLTYSVLTTHAITKGLTYAVLLETALTKALKYVVTAAHQLTLALKYVVTAPHSETKGLTYGVKTTHSDTKSLGYSVLTTTSHTLNLTYAVNATATFSLTKSLTYGVVTSTTITKGLVYGVETSHSTTLGLSYSVRLQTDLTKTLRYAVQTTHSLALGLVYTVQTATPISKNLTYVVTAPHSITLGLTYGVLTTTNQTKGLRYAVQTTHADTLSLGYFVQTTTTIAKNLTYALRLTITKLLAYAILTTHQISKGLTYDVLTSSAITKSLGYSVLTQHPETKTLTYSVQTTHAITLGLSYSVGTGSTIQKGLTYAVVTSTTIQKGLTYAITSPVAITKTLAYGVQTTHTAQLGLTYSVDTLHQISKSLTYVVTSPVTKQISLQYGVLTTATLQLGLTYAVTTTTTTALTRGLSYSVLTQHQISENLTYAVRTTTSVTKSLGYAVHTTHTASILLRYAVKISKTIALGLTYGVVVTEPALTKSLAYSVKLTTNEQKTLAYAVKATLQIQLGLTYATRNNAALSLSLGYSVETAHALTLGLEYAVTASPTIQRSLAYSVLTTHLMQLGLSYEIARTIAKSLTYAVTPPGPASEHTVLTTTGEKIRISTTSDSSRLSSTSEVTITKLSTRPQSTLTTLQTERSVL